MDCETSDRFAGDENIWQFSNWRTIVGFPELESLPDCLAKTPVSVLRQPNSCRKFRPRFSVEATWL